MDQTEIFELCENTEKLLCPDCKSFTEVEIISCRCGRNLKYKRSPKPNLDCNSFDGNIIRKNSSRGPKHGPSERQWMFFKAQDMLRKAKKKGFPTILARWQEQESYRSSLKDCDIGEKEIVIYDQLALERHDCAATKAERMRYSQKWVLSVNVEGKQTTSTTTPRLRRSKTRMSTPRRPIHGSKRAALYTHPPK